ncbi:MAG: sigma 54-interacting transcriptional regulator [Planctomycetes bacterium]|nr:sigma 54-interacting transcriptional regulator [Planctomycetota bacterium]
MTHVLLIDDESATRLVMANRLKEAGHEVTIAENGAQGVASSRERRFDAILVDAGLSAGINGQEVCRRLRQIPTNTGVPLLLLSKASSREDLPRGYEAGADMCLVKSDLPVLDHVLRVFLRLKSEQDELRSQARSLAEAFKRAQEERARPSDGEPNGAGSSEPATVWRELAPGKPDGVVIVDDEGIVRYADRGAQDLFGGPIDGKNLGRLSPASGLEAFVRDTNLQKKEGQRFDLPPRNGRQGRSVIASVVTMVAKPGDVDPGLRVVLFLDAGRRKVATEMIRLQEYTLPRREVGVLIEAARVAYGTANLIGSGAAMTRIRAAVTEFAKSSMPVLLIGETGSGRAHIARALHFSSDSAGNPFLPVACAGLSAEHLELELFGAVKGANPEVTFDRPGALHMGRGTLYLSDVDQLSPRLQSKLLRAIREGVACRTGSDRAETTEMRVVASTQVDLQRAVEAGTFDGELLRELLQAFIVVPPLRERADDIEPLTMHFLRMFGSGRPELELAPQALARIQGHVWPGNVLELKSAIDRACKRAPGAVIQLEHLPPSLRDGGYEMTPVASPKKLVFGGSGSAFPSTNGSTISVASAFAHRPGEVGPDDPISLDHYEKKCLERALEATGGDKLKAAKLLKVGKSTLYRKLKRYEIS